MGRIVTKVRQARLDHSARIGRPVSMAEAARQIGISREMMRRIEGGKASISLSVLAGLCELYDCQPGDLLSYEELAALQLAEA